jgi:hypothetical protein
MIEIQLQSSSIIHWKVYPQQTNGKNKIIVK